MGQKLIILAASILLASSPAFGDPFRARGSAPQSTKAKLERIKLTKAEREYLKKFNEVLSSCADRNRLAFLNPCDQKYGTEEHLKEVKKEDGDLAQKARESLKLLQDCRETQESELKYACLNANVKKLPPRMLSYWMIKYRKLVNKLNEVHSGSEEYRTQLTGKDWITRLD